jgi:hypothetical protein
MQTETNDDVTTQYCPIPGCSVSWAVLAEHTPPCRAASRWHDDASS